jgi:hypothetical protein
MAVSQTYVRDESLEQPRHGLSADRVFIWVALILALAFWLSYVVLVEGAMLGLF